MRRGESLAEHEACVREAAIMTRCGRSAREIAMTLGVAPRTVYRWRSLAGVAKLPSRRITPEEWDIAERLLDEGASYSEAGRTIGVWGCTVGKHFPGRGWSEEESIAFATMVRVLG